MRKTGIAGGLVAALLLAGFAAPAGATFPGSNGSIVYVDRGHVMTIAPDGTSERRLTKGPGNSDPAFSADGKRIVYTHKVGKRSVIDVMKADGSAKRQLTRRHADSTPAFSPSGKRIVFSRTLHTKQCDLAAIFVGRADGSHVSKLTRAKPVFCDVEREPSYSPNGRTIVFESLEAEDFWISAIDADGKHRRTLRDNVLGPSFAPGGQQILFGEGFVPSSQIGVINADGSDPHDISASQVPRLHYSLPSYSPDGSKIVFTGLIGRNADIYVMNPDGSGLAKLTDGGTSAEPDWGALATG